MLALGGLLRTSCCGLITFQHLIIAFRTPCRRVGDTLSALFSHFKSATLLDAFRSYFPFHGQSAFLPRTEARATTWEIFVDTAEIGSKKELIRSVRKLREETLLDKMFKPGNYLSATHISYLKMTYP